MGSGGLAGSQGNGLEQTALFAGWAAKQNKTALN